VDRRDRRRVGTPRPLRRANLLTSGRNSARRESAAPRRGTIAAGDPHKTACLPVATQFHPDVGIAQAAREAYAAVRE